MLFKNLFHIWLFFIPSVIHSQVTAPCGLDYGTSSDEANIIEKMRFGNNQEARNAIYLGMNSRGTLLGCPQEAIVYQVPDFTPPSLSEIENIWNSVHKPAIDGIVVDCPRIGRYENNAALGAYYARLAGYYDDLSVLSNVNDMMENQQYTLANVVSVVPQHEGVFAYIHVPLLNPCYPGGVVGSSVDAVCSAIPAFCLSYDFGSFAGEDFLVGDQSEADSFYDGGIAYDHGWVGVAMIEAAIQQDDSILKSRYKTSAILAAKWAIAEKTVKNHNYTAKLIWLLAEMYNWSGDEIYKNELNNKLNRNLLPGIIMDRDDDGYVDSLLSTVAFSDLTGIADTPGRMWDGHNALPWYNAMNAWAITESYVAFRDRGETARANELKPYMVAMLDNLAEEIANEGVINGAYLGVRDLSYAFLIGIWKVSQYESETHLNWENAAWALWNTGAFNSYNTNSVCVGLYLIVRNNIPYEPLFQREEFNSIPTITYSPGLILFPNPAANSVHMKYDNIYQESVFLEIYDLQGRRIYERELKNGETQVDLENFSAGTYILNLEFTVHPKSLRQKLIIQ